MKDRKGTAPEKTMEFVISPYFGLRPTGNLHSSLKKNLRAKKSLLKSVDDIQSTLTGDKLLNPTIFHAIRIPQKRDSKIK
tara:strand:+ start:2232 stop:2471 length:240 start_codon:yes stop_codon:yes gene_type:complete